MYVIMWLLALAHDIKQISYSLCVCVCVCVCNLKTANKDSPISTFKGFALQGNFAFHQTSHL
jgi:hypothetical protein